MKTITRICSHILIFIAITTSFVVTANDSASLSVRLGPITIETVAAELKLNATAKQKLRNYLDNNQPALTQTPYQWATIPSEPALLNKARYLSFGFARLPWLEVYQITSDKIALVAKHTPVTGFTDRYLPAAQLYVPLSSSNSHYLIRYQTFANTKATLQVLDQETVQQQIVKSSILNGALVGIILAALGFVVINLYFNFNATNISYSIWTTLFMLIVLDMSGFTIKYFWPDSGLFSSVFTVFLMTVVPIFHLLFISNFLSLKRYSRQLHLSCNAFIAAYILLIPVAFVTQSVLLNLILSFSIAPFLTYIAFWAHRQQSPGSTIFALSLLNHVILVNIIAIGGVLTFHYLDVKSVSTAIKLGYLLEVTLFAVALAKQHKAAQKELLHTLEHQVQTLSSSIEIGNQQKVAQQRRLLTDLSHELRTPLTVMKVQIECLQHNIVENVSESYAKLMNKTNELNTLINQFMLVTEPNQLNKILTLSEIDVQTLINQVHSLVITSIPHSIDKVRVTHQITSIAKLNVDIESIKKVFSEIVSNALTHGGDGVEVHIDCKVINNILEVTIDDDGSPLAQTTHDNMFDPLYKLNTSRNRTNHSTGMGLAICKRIIEGHGGVISSKNNNIGGVQINFSLPLLS
ncbi:sensor histidine kinase (plasmid) [Pseudoalteromonas sp. T1lg65]|uniref:sensor histidine kinase n=1 Tax=Pseudoalteromonas sp. T1lg65 TaxID=2077101 RepID=UPI003F78DCD5